MTGRTFIIKAINSPAIYNTIAGKAAFKNF
jgi:hypothetical protein